MNVDGSTQWEPPVQSAASSSTASKEAELHHVQAKLREQSNNEHSLHITLYLTGCKKEDVQLTQSAEPGSRQELINGLLSTTDPVTGEPYIKLKAGRPDWDGEFGEMCTRYGKSEIGVIFCGAPMIAHALKENCGKYSKVGGTVFRLHKENF